MFLEPLNQQISLEMQVKLFGFVASFDGRKRLPIRLRVGVYEEEAAFVFSPNLGSIELCNDAVTRGKRRRLLENAPADNMS